MRSKHHFTKTRSSKFRNVEEQGTSLPNQTAETLFAVNLKDEDFDTTLRGNQQFETCTIVLYSRRGRVRLFTVSHLDIYVLFLILLLFKSKTPRASRRRQASTPAKSSARLHRKYGQMRNRAIQSNSCPHSTKTKKRLTANLTQSQVRRPSLPISSP